MLPSSGLQAQPSEDLIKGHLHPDVEIAELPIAYGDRIEAHLINDGLDVAGILGKQGDAPLGIIKAGRSRNQLQDAAGVFAASSGMPLH